MVQAPSDFRLTGHFRSLLETDTLNPQALEDQPNKALVSNQCGTIGGFPFPPPFSMADITLIFTSFIAFITAIFRGMPSA